MPRRVLGTASIIGTDNPDTSPPMIWTIEEESGVMSFGEAATKLTEVDGENMRKAPKPMLKIDSMARAYWMIVPGAEGSRRG